MLEIRNFNKTFLNQVTALKQVNLKLNAGEFVVVLGPSGSGKSTLLRCINGLVKPDEGSLFFNGSQVRETDTPEFRKNFGMIFQHFNLTENLSVMNNIMTGVLPKIHPFFSLFYYFPKKIKLKALKCLDKVHLLDKAYEKTSRLSGGQKQRVGIARAIMQEPSVILADEPIANLDPVTSKKILQLLKEICRKNNIAIICNLHQVDLALQFADRIVCLCEGEVVLNDKTENLNSQVIHEMYHGRQLDLDFKKAV